MELFETFAKRGSYRDEFLPEPVPAEDLERILTAGLLAPSGMNYQTTSFVMVTDPSLLSALAGLIQTKAMATAPAMAVLFSSSHPSPAGMSFEIEDYAAAAENILLAVTALGYAGVWTDGQTRRCHEQIEALLNAPAGFTARAVIPFGRPKKDVVQNTRRPREERVFRNRF